LPKPAGDDLKKSHRLRVLFWLSTRSYLNVKQGNLAVRGGVTDELIVAAHKCVLRLIAKFKELPIMREYPVEELNLED